MRLKQLVSTFQLIFFALLPPASSGHAAPTAGDLPTRCSPRQLRSGADSFLDSGGEFQLLFPHALGLAAPFVLFRLKREGYSRCSVKVLDQGLLVQGRR